MLYYKDTKLRRRRRGIYRRQSKQISYKGRQGASNKRANNRLAEFGRIWQVTRPSTVISPHPPKKSLPLGVI